MAPSLVELKEDAREHRPPGDPYREAILAEHDEVSAQEYAAKVPVWLTLLRLHRVERGARIAQEPNRVGDPSS